MPLLGKSEVLVVGGGPAGLTAAIAMRLRGLAVTVIDAGRAPIDRACGEGILPAGVRTLRRLGVRISTDDGFTLRGIRFLSDGNGLEAKFPSGLGMGLRRTRLHQILADRASELGVRLLWDTPLTDSFELRPYGWIVGADGQNSRVRRAAGLDAGSKVSLRFGFRRHYQVSPWTDFVEVHWGARCQVYITPVSDREIGVAVLSRDPRIRLNTALNEFPELQKRLRGGGESGAERGAVTASRRLRSVFSGNTVLIGDASGSVDAITGDGLSLSFQQAIALSEALYAGHLEAYQAEHRRLARRPALMGSLLLLMDRFPSVRRCVLRMLAGKPPIFAKLLAQHSAT
jgi:menaquinone-9 beta-reductase